MEAEEIDYKQAFEKLRAENEQLKKDPNYRAVLLRRDYEASQALQREFKDVKTYLAYMHAHERGAAKITGHK